MTQKARVKFWLEPDLDRLTQEEWEQLCDGCGKCCLHKLQDEDTGELVFTRIACQYLDLDRITCRDYPNRMQRSTSCIKVTPEMARRDDVLPSTCSYRLIAQGLPLPNWHPLLTGDKKSVVELGESVSGAVISEEYIHPDGYEEHIIRWVHT